MNVIVDAPPVRFAALPPPDVESIPATVSDGGRYAAVVFFFRSPGGGGTELVVVRSVDRVVAAAATIA